MLPDAPIQRTHESSGEGLVGPDLSVDLDESLLNNSSNLLSGQGVLQSVSEEDGEGKGLSELVGTWRRSGCLRDVSVLLPLMCPCPSRGCVEKSSQNSRKYHRACPASMMKELRAFSSAFLVLVPMDVSVHSTPSAPQQVEVEGLQRHVSHPFHELCSFLHHPPDLCVPLLFLYPYSSSTCTLIDLDLLIPARYNSPFC